MNSPFETFENRDLVDLITEYPLAWVTAHAGDGKLASLLPLLPEVDESGRLSRLLGHMSRANPLLRALSLDPRVLVLFQGPQEYISGSWVRDRSWVPTWNFAQVRIDGDLSFEEEGGDAALDALVGAMEAGREGAWRIEEAGARYRSMERRIIAFRIGVQGLHARFKLGQDERPENLRDILSHVANQGLARWMRRFNPGRC